MSEPNPPPYKCGLRNHARTMSCSPCAGIVVDGIGRTWERPYFTHLPREDRLVNLALFTAKTGNELEWVRYNNGTLEMVFRGDEKAVLTKRLFEQ